MEEKHIELCPYRIVTDDIEIYHLEGAYAYYKTEFLSKKDRGKDVFLSERLITK